MLVIAIDPAELDPVVETLDNVNTQGRDCEWLRGGGSELDQGRVMIYFLLQIWFYSFMFCFLYQSLEE